MRRSPPLVGVVGRLPLSSVYFGWLVSRRVGRGLACLCRLVVVYRFIIPWRVLVLCRVVPRGRRSSLRRRRFFRLVRVPFRRRVTVLFVSRGRVRGRRLILSRSGSFPRRVMLLTLRVRMPRVLRLTRIKSRRLPRLCRKRCRGMW